MSSTSPSPPQPFSQRVYIPVADRQQAQQYLYSNLQEFDNSQHSRINDILNILGKSTAELKYIDAKTRIDIDNAVSFVSSKRIETPKQKPRMDVLEKLFRLLNLNTDDASTVQELATYFSNKVRILSKAEEFNSSLRKPNSSTEEIIKQYFFIVREFVNQHLSYNDDQRDLWEKCEQVFHEHAKDMAFTIPFSIDKIVKKLHKQCELLMYHLRVQNQDIDAEKLRDFIESLSINFEFLQEEEVCIEE
mmetsp:Transcript_6781/g.25319  ORF Transcript_6781/g.25319 Transcript_6781/m.25319 type:complete len:247 (-) Transcript_6781:103-843(-)